MGPENVMWTGVGQRFARWYPNLAGKRLAIRLGWCEAAKARGWVLTSELGGGGPASLSSLSGRWQLERSVGLLIITRPPERPRLHPDPPARSSRLLGGGSAFRGERPAPPAALAADWPRRAQRGFGVF